MNATDTSHETPGANDDLAAESIETSAAETIGRRLQFDEHGHAIPPTPAENAADTEALLSALEEMAKIPDDPSEPDEEFWRAMDESHPERPRFKDLYQP